MPVSPGTLVGTKVRLKRLLGEGGMGSVWVADHLGLETEVAVKFVSADIAGTAEAVARFQREATAAAQLKSPHVVQVFDHGVTAEGVPYIIMELLEGEDLSARLQRVGSLSLPEVVSIVTQVCRALGKAHAQGVVHRDIKPENVFLTDSDGELFVKLLDFGIAKHTRDAAMSMTTTGSMVGTPYFMSPEQVMSAKGVDFRSDLWSVGVVAYGALLGKLPFVAETLGALCVRINDGRFDAATSVCPTLPAEIDDWFARALHRDPKQRFASAREMADALQRASGLSRVPAPASALPAVQPRPQELGRAGSSAGRPPSGAGGLQDQDVLWDSGALKGSSPAGSVDDPGSVARAGSRSSSERASLSRAREDTPGGAVAPGVDALRGPDAASTEGVPVESRTLLGATMTTGPARSNGRVRLIAALVTVGVVSGGIAVAWLGSSAAVAPASESAPSSDSPAAPPGPKAPVPAVPAVPASAPAATSADRALEPAPSASAPKTPIPPRAAVKSTPARSSGRAASGKPKAAGAAAERSGTPSTAAKDYGF